MNFTVSESIEFSNNIIKSLANLKNKNIEIIVCPTFMSLPYCYQILSSIVKLGAQNISHTDHEYGSYTGEISAKMISDYAEYVILGHSERRNFLNEGNSIINTKRLFSIKNNIKPIVCIGESIDIRNSGKHIDFLENQIKECIDSDYEDKIVAYEPVWAIGSGENCDLEKVEEISKLTKSILGNDTLFIYGGSVNKDNIHSYLSSSSIDGVLIGSASLDKNSIEEMLNIIDANS